MPRFSANLGHLFTEYALVERIGAAAKAGFKAIELQLPYEVAPSAVKAEIDRRGLGAQRLFARLILSARGGERGTIGERAVLELGGRGQRRGHGLVRQ